MPPALEGCWEAERSERPGISRVLEHSAPCMDRMQSHAETALVVAELASLWISYGAASVPLVAPPLTWRMRHDRPRPRILPCVSSFVPAIDALETGVTALRVDIESCDHFVPIRKVTLNVIRNAAAQ